MASARVIEMLEQQRVGAQAELDDLSARAKEKRALIKEIDESIAKLSDDPEAARRVARRSGRFTLNDQVLELLSADGDGHTPHRIAGILTEQGRETQNTTVSSILSRLRKAGDAEKRGDRWFRAKGTGAAATDPEENDDEEEAGDPEGPQKLTPDSAPPSSVRRAGKFLGGTSIASPEPIQFPLAREKGG